MVPARAQTPKSLLPLCELYFDRHVKLPEENPTIGILLCKRKKDAIVELTLPASANIHAKEYQLYLPSKELLQQKLIDWIRDAELVAPNQAL